MSGRFLTKSHHGTTFNFGRRVALLAQASLGPILESLQTGNKRLAFIRGRALATY